MWNQAAQESFALLLARAGLVEQSSQVLAALLFVCGVELSRNDGFTDTQGQAPVSSTDVARRQPSRLIAHDYCIWGAGGRHPACGNGLSPGDIAGAEGLLSTADSD